MIEVSVQKAGMLSLMVDAGRMGYQAFGVTKGGPMDRKAARVANLLVGNPSNSPVLELTMMGPKLAFHHPARIALTGADMSARFEGEDISLNTVFHIKLPGILSFGRLKQGCRTYLAIAGQWRLADWLGSQSAFLPFPIPALQASRLYKGQRFQIQSPGFTETIPELSLSLPQTDLTKPIRILPGPEFEQFSKTEIALFFGNQYRIANDANRMGYRLLNSRLPENPKRGIISSGTVPGTIQITHSGQPIILMADAQTTGGYARIGNVISADLDRLGQAKPGDEISFSLISLAEARAVWQTYRL